MTAKSPKVLRSVCLIAFAAGLYGCATSEQPKPTVEPQKPVEAPAPAPTVAPPAEAPAPPPAPPQAAPQQPAPKVARKPARKRKPVVKAEAQPAPPPPPPVAAPPAPSPEQERARRLDEYIAAMQKSAITFNPPSPIQIGQRAVAPLSVNPPKEAAQAADDLRKSLAPGSTWSPQMRAQLAGADFEISPADGKDSSGVKDLSMTGRTEWSWAIVPQSSGTKRLTVRVSLLLPEGAARELPAIERSVEVQSTLLGRIGDWWNEYWLWIVGVLVVVVAAIVLLRRRAGGGA